MNYRLLLIGLLSLCFCACQSKKTFDTTPSTNAYAEGFAIAQENDGVRLVIFSPQNREQIQGEYFIPNDKPYQRLATTSATHIGFLAALTDSMPVAGVCDPLYIYNKVSAHDLGSSLNLDAERIIACGADALILSYTADDKSIDLLQQMGISIIYNNEWTERHPLARAEWIRMMGAVTGHLREADSIFSHVRNAYESLVAQSQSDAQPSILSGNCWQGTWYVPGGDTYMARLFRDAGAQYAYSKNTSSESIPLSFEQALIDFRDADIWVGAPGHTLDELAQLDEKHTWFKAYQTGRVYSFSRRSNGAYANDFWESGVVHPELILSDLQHIIRQDNDSLLYFTQRLE
ncbi:MAG: ABC transporter substrate-binding protein [Paludibacteraceae bacterium]|nr:ABC transporter substrate-binding protein [Paludibacteraceae bacterium]